MLDGEVHIVKRAVRGDSSAFGLLYDHYHPKIYRFVMVKTSHREEAEDLTHQVFLKAWQNIRRYKHLGFPFSSWLYKIARNQIADYYRTRRVELRIEHIGPEHEALQAGDEHLAGILEAERVRRAIVELKPEYQDVIIMRFIEDISIRETAAALERSEGAVKLLQHRAIKELRKALAPRQ